MKDFLCGIVGFVGSIFASFFGGFDAAIITLIAFMAVDFVSGLVCAGVFGASEKTENGALESNTCWKGICKKVMTLVLVFVAHRVDISLGTTYVRDTVTIAFITSELISILENAGLMGLRIPKVLYKVIDILKDKIDDKEEKHGI